MRRRTPLAFAGFIVVVLAAVIGFASFTTERPEGAMPGSAGSIPEIISGRVSGAILVSRLTPATSPPTESTTSTVEPEAPRDLDIDAAAEIDATAVTTTAAPPTTVATTSPPPTAPPPTTTTTTTTPPLTFAPAVEQWRPLVTIYFPPSLRDEALSVMGCESGGDPNARNVNSTAGGLFQFIASTWESASPAAGFTQISVYDPEANIATAAFLVDYSLDRGLSAWQHWVCQPNLGSS